MSLPFRSIITIISLQAFLLGIQSYIEYYELGDELEDKIVRGFIMDVVSLFTTLLSVLFTDRFKAGGRSDFLYKNCLVLGGTFILSISLLYVDQALYILIGTFLQILQTVAKVNILTTILSIVFLQYNEVGFYFGLQFIIFEVCGFFGGTAYLIFESSLALTVFYLVSIFIFFIVSRKIHASLSEEHDEVNSSDWTIFLEIIQVKFFTLNFVAFSISLGVASYIFLLLTNAFETLKLSVFFLVSILMFLSYPVGLYLLYRYMRPVHNKAFTVLGLGLQSLALFFLMLVYADNGKNSQIFIIFSPILSQLGLVFVTIAALPDMVESTIKGLPYISKGIITDRVCSLVYLTYYVGKVLVIITTYVLREIASFLFGLMIGAILILAFAAVYEYYGNGLREYKRGQPKQEFNFSATELKEAEDLNTWLNN